MTYNDFLTLHMLFSYLGTFGQAVLWPSLPDRREKIVAACNKLFQTQTCQRHNKKDEGRLRLRLASVVVGVERFDTRNWETHVQKSGRLLSSDSEGTEYVQLCPQVKGSADTPGFSWLSQTFWWGDLLSGTILGPHQGRNQMGGRLTSGDLSGTESDEGDLEKNVRWGQKCPPSAKLEQILVF